MDFPFETRHPKGQMLLKMWVLQKKWHLVLQEGFSQKHELFASQRAGHASLDEILFPWKNVVKSELCKRRYLPK